MFYASSKEAYMTAEFLDAEIRTVAMGGQGVSKKLAGFIKKIL